MRLLEHGLLLKILRYRKFSGLRKKYFNYYIFFSIHKCKISLKIRTKKTVKSKPEQMFKQKEENLSMQTRIFSPYLSSYQNTL